MSRVLPIESSATQPQSTQPGSGVSPVGCGGIVGGTVVKQLVLPSLVKREEIANDLRDLVKEIITSDTTIKDFGEALGVDKSTMSRKLNGRPGYDVNAEDLAAIVELKLPSGVKLGNWYARHYDMKPLEPRRVVTDAEISAAVRAVAATAGPLGERLLELVALQLGVDVSSVRR